MCNDQEAYDFVAAVALTKPHKDDRTVAPEVLRGLQARALEIIEDAHREQAERDGKGPDAEQRSNLEGEHGL